MTAGHSTPAGAAWTDGTVELTLGGLVTPHTPVRILGQVLSNSGPDVPAHEVPLRPEGETVLRGAGVGEVRTAWNDRTSSR